MFDWESVTEDGVCVCVYKAEPGLGLPRPAPNPPVEMTHIHFS